MEIGIVVPCTDSKRNPAPTVHLGAVEGRGLTRTRAWLTRLEARTVRVRARELYKGVGWQASLDLVGVAERVAPGVRTVIVSAGYGALQPHDEVANYSATFIPGHPDSVAAPSSTAPTEENRAWWREINHLRGTPRPVADLAGKVDALVVAASARYVDALGEDIARATTVTPTLIFCSGKPRDERLHAFCPHFDRRLREGPTPFVQANDQNLNQCVAGAVISRLGEDAFNVAVASRLLKSAMDRPPPVRHQRRVTSDTAVKRFIERSLRDDPSATKSSLLRRWRDAGYACEQRRFGRLFADVRSTHQEEKTGV